MQLTLMKSTSSQALRTELSMYICVVEGQGGQREEGTEGEVRRGRGACVRLEMLISYPYVAFCFHVC